MYTFKNINSNRNILVRELTYRILYNIFIISLVHICYTVFCNMFMSYSRHLKIVSAILQTDLFKHSLLPYDKCWGEVIGVIGYVLSLAVAIQCQTLFQMLLSLTFVNVRYCLQLKSLFEKHHLNSSAGSLSFEGTPRTIFPSSFFQYLSCFSPQTYKLKL